MHSTLKEADLFSFFFCSAAEQLVTDQKECAGDAHKKHRTLDKQCEQDAECNTKHGISDQPEQRSHPHQTKKHILYHSICFSGQFLHNFMQNNTYRYSLLTDAFSMSLISLPASAFAAAST